MPSAKVTIITDTESIMTGPLVDIDMSWTFATLKKNLESHSKGKTLKVCTAHTLPHNYRTDELTRECA